MTYTPDQLHNAIEAGFSYGESELSALVRLARQLPRLAPAGPDADASRRMRLRFEALMAGEPQHRAAWWWPFGGGDWGRPTLAQRFAAGALMLSAIGGTASVVTGVTPADAARATVRIVAGTVQNLTPHTFLEEFEPGAAPPTEATLPAPGPSTNQQDQAGPPGEQAPSSADARPAGEPPAGDGPAAGESPSPTATPAAGQTSTPSPTPAGSSTAPTATPSPASSPVPPTANPELPPAFNPAQPPSTLAPPTATATPSPSPSPSSTPSPSPTPTGTATPSPTPTPPPHEDDDEPEDDSESDDDQPEVDD